MSIKKLKEMMDHPSGKDFHKKYGLPGSAKAKALDNSKRNSASFASHVDRQQKASSSHAKYLAENKALKDSVMSKYKKK